MTYRAFINYTLRREEHKKSDIVDGHWVGRYGYSDYTTIFQDLSHIIDHSDHAITSEFEQHGLFPTRIFFYFYINDIRDIRESQISVFRQDVSLMKLRMEGDMEEGVVRGREYLWDFLARKEIGGEKG